MLILDGGIKCNDIEGKRGIIVKDSINYIGDNSDSEMLFETPVLLRGGILMLGELGHFHIQWVIHFYKIYLK